MSSDSRAAGGEAPRRQPGAARGAGGLSRREVLKAGAALQLLALLPAALARSVHMARTPSEGDRVLVVLQLTGGNDGLNTVVPFADDRYHRARPVLALPPAKVVRLDDHLGLHPSLSALQDAWDEGSLAVVQGVGPPVPDRSHFRSMEMWHTARTDETPPTAGWLGLLAAGLADPLGLPVVRVGGRDLPLALAGATSQVPALAGLDDLHIEGLSGGSGESARELLRELCSTEDGRSGEAAFIAAADASAFECARRLAALEHGAEQHAAPDSDLARALHLAARIIGARLGTRVIYVTQGGYDTHAQQSRAHELLLRELGNALAGFSAQLVSQGDEQRVVSVVFSEFGRRIHENASGGTDHGAGNPVLVLGRPVQGGLVGADPDLSGEVDADVPVTTDFRSVYVTALDWLGLPAAVAVPGQHARLPLFA